MAKPYTKADKLRMKRLMARITAAGFTVRDLWLYEWLIDEAKTAAEEKREPGANKKFNLREYLLGVRDSYSPNDALEFFLLDFDELLQFQQQYGRVNIRKRGR